MCRCRWRAPESNVTNTPQSRAVSLSRCFAYCHITCRYRCIYLRNAQTVGYFRFQIQSRALWKNRWHYRNTAARPWASVRRTVRYISYWICGILVGLPDNRPLALHRKLMKDAGLNEELPGLRQCELHMFDRPVGMKVRYAGRCTYATLRHSDGTAIFLSLERFVNDARAW